MTKYVEIYYDKQNKTQRFVLCGPMDCTSKINKTLQMMGIIFTNNKFIGKYEPLKDYKSQTFKYATKWQWLNTIDITKGEF